MTLSAFLVLWALHLMAAISPGPAVLMAARTGLTQGFRTGLFLAMGIGLGGVFWASLAFSGLSVLFKSTPTLSWTIRIVGGIYLIYMAVGMWRGADRPLDMSQVSALPRSPAAAIWQGAVTQLTNPKTVAMFSAIFLGTVPAGTPLWQYGAVLLAVFLNETIWCSLAARVFSFDRSRTTCLRLKSVIDRAFGGLLMLLGLKLAATT